MTSTRHIQLTKRTVVPWLCSVSPVIGGILLALLALHGWWLGGSASITENSGPMLFEAHYVLMGVFVLFATWLAAPTWLGFLIARNFRQPVPELVLQVLVFICGWILLLLAGILVEASPARSVF
jgi:hypothetical protein